MATPRSPNSTASSTATQSQASKATHFSTERKRSQAPPAQFSSMCKVVITIPSLVCLRRALRRWRSRASSSSSSSSAVPAGHVAVSVESRRFAVRVAHLSHPAFVELLRQAEEEYGFPAAPGPIALPCDEDHFLDVLHRVSSSSTSASCCGSSRRRRGDARPLLRGMAVEKVVSW